MGIPRVSAGTSWGCYCSCISSAGTHRIQLPITRYSRPHEHFLEKEYRCHNRCSISGKLSFLSFSFFFRKCLIYVKRCRITHRSRSLVQGKPSQAHESRQLDRRDMKSVPGQVQLLRLYYIVQAVLFKSLFNSDSLSTPELRLKNNKRNFQSKSATRRCPRKQKELPRPATLQRRLRDCDAHHSPSIAVEMLSSPGVLWMKTKPSMMWMWIYRMKLYWHGWISFILIFYRILFSADWSSVNYHGCSHCLLFSWICVFWRSAILLDENNVYYFFMVLLHMEFGQWPWMKFPTILKDFFLVEISNSVWMKSMSIFQCFFPGWNSVNHGWNYWFYSIKL